MINNTLAIAKKCNVSLTTDQYFLPEYPVPEEHDFNSFLSELSKTQLDEIIKSYSKEDKLIYQKRLDYELVQIHATGFSSYFLIVAILFNGLKIMMYQLVLVEVQEQDH